MDRIKAAVAAAERKAQAAYDKALDELRRTGKVTDIETISLDDEGVAGERIDAELELVDRDAAGGLVRGRARARRRSSTAGTRGPAWIVTIPANTYRAKTRTGSRASTFVPAETRLYFGAMPKPDVRARVTSRCSA